jgi:enoyl-CoA hydratase/carnithine racemase
MTVVVQTLDGVRWVDRTPGGIVLGPHGLQGSEAWLLTTEAASELVEMLTGLDNDSRPAVLGSVEAVTNIGRVELRVILTGAAVELRDARRLGVVRWTVRQVDQVEALAEALAVAVGATAPTQVEETDDAVVVPAIDDPNEGLAKAKEAARSETLPKHTRSLAPARRR